MIRSRVRIVDTSCASGASDGEAGLREVVRDATVRLPPLKLPLDFGPSRDGAASPKGCPSGSYLSAGLVVISPAHGRSTCRPSVRLGLPATLSLMDWDGRKRVSLGSGLGRLFGKEVGGEGLTLAGPDGKTTLSLASIPDRTHLTLFDSKGDGRAAFTFFLGQARLQFFDGSLTNQRAHLDASGLTLSDETGRLQAALASTSTGAAFLLKDRNGRTLWSVP